MHDIRQTSAPPIRSTYGRYGANGQRLLSSSRSFPIRKLGRISNDVQPSTQSTSPRFYSPYNTSPRRQTSSISYNNTTPLSFHCETRPVPLENNSSYSASTTNTLPISPTPTRRNFFPSEIRPPHQRTKYEINGSPGMRNEIPSSSTWISRYNYREEKENESTVGNLSNSSSRVDYSLNNLESRPSYPLERTSILGERPTGIYSSEVTYSGTVG